MTTRSAGSTSRSGHAGGGADRWPRGGDGSAAMVPPPYVGRRMRFAAGDISSRALAAQLGHVEFDLAQPAGEIGLQRRLRQRRPVARRCAECEQHGRHLVGGVGRHPGRLDGVDDGVVVAHQSGALGPADQRVGDGDPSAPRTIPRSSGSPRRRVRTSTRRRRRRRRTCRGSASRAAPRAAGRRCHGRRRSPRSRRSVARPPTAGPSSPSRSANRPPRDHRPPGARRTGTAAWGSARP